REQCDPLSPCAERVRDARPGWTRDNRAGPNRMLGDAFPLPEQQLSRAGEADEDLLLCRMAVRGGVELAGEHVDVAQPGPYRPRGSTEVANPATDGRGVPLAGLD